MFALVYIFGFGIQYLCVFMDMHYSVFVFDLVYLFLEQYLCVHMDLLYTVQYSCVWFGIFVLVSLCLYGYTVPYSCVCLVWYICERCACAEGEYGEEADNRGEGASPTEGQKVH